MRTPIFHAVRRYRILLLALLFLLLSAPAVKSQSTIPLGTWRLHLSYNNIHSVEVTNEKVFAASESGILVFDRQEKSLTTLNKLNGLGSTGITMLRHDPQTKQLLAAYEDGGLDIITSETITNFTRLKDAEVTSSKKINHISIHDNFAYLSTAYGVVLFDLQQLEIKETWRDLGASGDVLPVYGSTFLEDSVFLATGNGVLAGSLTDNLLDYNNWKRFNTGNFSGVIPAIVTFNGQVYAAGPTGLYRLSNGKWIMEPFLDTVSIESLSASAENLFMITGSSIWALNASGQLTQVTPELVTSPTVIQQDEQGNLWVGDRRAGLVSNSGGTFSSYLPNGPSLAQVTRMVFDNGKLYALSGGFSPSGQPLGIAGDVNVFENGEWKTISYPFTDVTDIAHVNGKTFLATFGSGIGVTDESEIINFFDETNSPLASFDPGRSDIPDIEAAENGLWVANYGAGEPLHFLNADDAWNSYSLSFPNIQNPIALSVDRNGNVWIVLNPATGGGLVAFEPKENRGHYKTNAAGSGNLPDKNVRSITTDLEGYIWAGTDAGVVYFLSVSEDAIRPIYENRFLLRDEKITAIEVDGGNRKWIGSEQGAWLFTPTGETLLHYFTAENSPLLSNAITDIEINSETGEVFFATDKGIASFRSDAVRAGPQFDKLKIFPNPVHPGFTGTVGIMGLSNDANIRITDISGKLIWQTRANGGMATWNVRSADGKRAATGIYLVFAASEDGTESMVGKIAVIE